MEIEISLGTKVGTLFKGLLRFIPSRFRNIILTPIVRVLIKISGGKVFGVMYDQKIRITDVSIFAAILQGEWEPHVVKYFCDCIEPGMTVIDVGARRGTYSLIAANLVGVSGSVLAFEPVPQFSSEINLNAKMNGYRNIKIYEVALSNRNGSIDLYLDKGCCGSFAAGITNSPKGLTVKERKFDSLAITEGIERANVVKIDVEGAEYQVIEGMKDMLSSDSVTIFCEVHPIHLHKLGYNVGNLFYLFKNLGFDSLQIIEENGKLNKNYDSVLDSKRIFHIIATK